MKVIKDFFTTKTWSLLDVVGFIVAYSIVTAIIDKVLNVK